jgi:glycosyltransferase involved in cell wall biosynthesis
MLLTVGICTWNRAALLREALAALSRSDLPARLEWEVVVVDNGSTDGTASVVAEFRDRLPVRSIAEPRPGLSHARNRCVDEFRGDYLLWTDDDVIVSPEWVREYASAFQERPAAAVFGGPVRPRFEGSRPAWLGAAWADVHNAYGIRDLGDAVAPLDARNLPFGSNYAVRRAEQRAHRYDPRLGRNRDAVLGGEEVAVLGAILRAGGEGLWLPAAPVDHWIPRRRQTTRYLARYYRGQGRVLALRGSPDAGSKRNLLGRPLWLWRRAIELEAIYRLSRLRRGPERWVGDLARASTTWGLLAGWPVGPAPH